MKVLFMITRDPLNPGASGGDIQPWEFASYLASVGHPVTFLTSGFRGAPKEELLQGVRVVRLGRVLSLWFRTFVYYMLHCKGRYDVVVEEGFGGSRIPRFAPLYVRVPIVTEWHQIHRDLFISQYPRVLVPLLNVLERLTAYLHRNTLVRTNTQDWREVFPTIGFRKENIFVLPASLREEWLNQEGTGPVSEPRIVWLGKFRRYKCPHQLVLAMKQVVTQIPQAQLILAGRHDDRKYEQELGKLVEELHLKESVEFLFDITEEEKRKMLRSCRVCVLPSSVEGFGVVVLEANACGTPVVASSGVPEGAVRHNSNGLRYPFGDISSLADSVIQVLTDDELYTRLSANSMKFVKDFAWWKVGAQYEEVLQRALNRDKQAPAV